MLKNKLPTKRKIIRKPTAKQKKIYKLYTEKRTLDIWNLEDVKLIIEIYAHVFAVQYQTKNLCKTCKGAREKILRISKELDIVFKIE